MKNVLINHVISKLPFDGHVTVTKQSTRYSSIYTIGDSNAEFTIIFHHSDDSAIDYKVQFNGRMSQNLNKKHMIREKIASMVENSINDNIPDLTTLLRVARRNIKTNSHFNRGKRKQRNKTAKKSRRINRR